MTRILLAELVGCHPAEVEIRRRCAHCGHPDHGKPHLAGGNGPWFSVSSSGTVVVATSSHVDVGVDVEVTGRSLGALVDTLCTRADRDLLDSLVDEREREAALLRLWTRKEAVLKLIGTGLSIPLHSVECRDGTRDGVRTASTLGMSGPMWVYDLPGVSSTGSVIALALEAFPSSIRIRTPSDPTDAEACYRPGASCSDNRCFPAIQD